PPGSVRNGLQPGDRRHALPDAAPQRAADAEVEGVASGLARRVAHVGHGARVAAGRDARRQQPHGVPLDDPMMTPRLAPLLALAAACACSPARDIQAPLAFKTLTLAASPEDASEPQIVVNGNRAIVSWIEMSELSATLKFAEYAERGWTAPRTAAAGA